MLIKKKIDFSAKIIDEGEKREEAAFTRGIDKKTWWPQTGTSTLL